MKTHPIVLVSILAVLTAAGRTAFAAPPAIKPALLHPVGSVDKSGYLISRGATIEEVRQTLGAPSRLISADTWVYPGFSAGNLQPSHDDCSILIVTFKAGVVAELQLRNERAVAVLAAQTRSHSLVSTVAAAGR